MKKNLFFTELRTSLYRALKFGIVGAIIGFILHAIWENLDTVFYTMITGFLTGFFVGLFELLFAHPKAGRLPYSGLLFLRTIIYFIITLFCVYLPFRIYLTNAGYSREVLSNPQIYADIEKVYYLANINTIYILLLTIAATFIWQLKSFFGRGVLLNYLTGKYHKPSIEERIFMFLDLNDATTIAEKLGSKKYSSFLGDFFKDIDIAFSQNKGKIFQYVGDEVVVIWNPKKGLKNNRCVQSFFSATNIIQDRKEYYIKNYNHVPSFKASLHIGEVTITEIGVSKKEIVYHGDTMNTASRICASAHNLNKSLLLSSSLYQSLDLSEDMEFEDLGNHTLKGKDEKVHLYSVIIQVS
jgi:adenylate cyclase